MTGTGKYLALYLAAAPLAAFSGALWADTPLTGGSFTVSALTTLSGGGQASYGTLSVSVVNTGGPVYSAQAVTGGVFAISCGATSALAPLPAVQTVLGPVHCYPVPFKPSAGDTKITFTNLAQDARVRIYTLSGRLVRALENSGAGTALDWDVKNGRGENAASGVYLYVVKSAGGTVTGKLMIIR